MLRVTIISFLLSLAIMSFAQPDGPNSPGTSGTDASVGSFAWSSSGNVLSSDNSVAVVNLDNSGDVSNYITVTNFGFAIPAGNSIDGIEVQIERSDNGGGGNIKDNIIKIIQGGIITGTDNSSGTTWPSTDTYKTYGSSIDLWGTAWTIADINSPNFGVAISAKRSGGGGNNQAKIDHISITVYYSTTLPIELSYFKGISNNNSISLEWETLSETNNAFFIIEKSADGFNFSEVDRIMGYGNSSTKNSYQLFDYEPLNGTNYYRMTQVDFNGKYEIFPVISCEFTIDRNEEIILNVFDVSGRLIHSESTVYSKRLDSIKNTPLSNGVYIVQYVYSNSRKVETHKYLLNSGNR